MKLSPQLAISDRWKVNDRSYFYHFPQYFILIYKSAAGKNVSSFFAGMSFFLHCKINSAFFCVIWCGFQFRQIDIIFDYDVWMMETRTETFTCVFSKNIISSRMLIAFEISMCAIQQQIANWNCSRLCILSINCHC